MVVPDTTVIVLTFNAWFSNANPIGAGLVAMLSIPLLQLALRLTLNVGVLAAATLVQSAKSNVVLPPVALPPTIVTLKDRKSPVAESRLPPSGITLSSHIKAPLPVSPLLPDTVNEYCCCAAKAGSDNRPIKTDGSNSFHPFWL